MSRALLLMATTGVVLVMFGGVALVDIIMCPLPSAAVPQCTGTLSDDIFGTPANDRISGLVGNDRMAGYEGSDTFRPGFGGNDVMAGGPGFNWYVYESGDWGDDRITDVGFMNFRFDSVVDDGVVVYSTNYHLLRLRG